ncbi:hypothetical protein CSUI_000683 [Cystoisospora suis]|uniref:Uncharacterized protein n=1 Tax=Cystoisospora suis TaxID=483139 RepID=A0A2C6LG14_9APIC|nr:hypothetical protein CSUI_000683 [Cystoisospora suis]
MREKASQDFVKGGQQRASRGYPSSDIYIYTQFHEDRKSSWLPIDLLGPHSARGDSGCCAGSSGGLVVTLR